MKLFRVRRAPDRMRTDAGSLLIVAPTADLAEELATKLELTEDFLKPELIWDPSASDHRVRVVHNDELA